MRPPVTRLAFIDALKAVASQLIVLHHLAFYGPMSDAAQAAAPALFNWLAHDARIAVQVFLVIGGYLAARGLAPAGLLTHDKPLALLKKRYFKLAVPFLGALLVSIALAALARQLMVDEAIPTRPTLGQFLAHALLLHGILGVDSLSAGVWYIAIDFQLFALMLGVLWLARGIFAQRAWQAGMAFVIALAAASLFHFNRQARWDNWALYYFGAYSLGALVYWTAKRPVALEETPGKTPNALIFITAFVAIALFIDFRSRILLALLTALSLGLSQNRGFLENRPDSPLLAWLGKISYSVFLIHFPLVLLINGLFVQLAPTGQYAGLIGIGIAWAASIVAGAFFYRVVEARSGFWQQCLSSAFKRLAGLFPPRAQERKET